MWSGYRFVKALRKVRSLARAESSDNYLTKYGIAASFGAPGAKQAYENLKKEVDELNDEITELHASFPDAMKAERIAMAVDTRKEAEALGYDWETLFSLKLSCSTLDRLLRYGCVATDEPEFDFDFWLRSEYDRLGL